MKRKNNKASQARKRLSEKGVKGGISSEGAKAGVGRSLTVPIPPKSAKNDEGTLSPKIHSDFFYFCKEMGFAQANRKAERGAVGVVIIFF